MPSDTLKATVSITGNTVELLFDQHVGDHPIMSADNEECVHEWVMSSAMWAQLECLALQGVTVQYPTQGNILVFDFLPRLDAIDQAAKVTKVVAEFHNKVAVLICTAD